MSVFGRGFNKGINYPTISVYTTHHNQGNRGLRIVGEQGLQSEMLQYVRDLVSAIVERSDVQKILSGVDPQISSIHT